MMATDRAALRGLLEGLVDYAGLFPPAALDMDDAVAAYHRHLSSPQAFMLGRFIVPAMRVGELVDAMQRVLGAPPPSPWRLSVTASPEDAGVLAPFNAEHGAWAFIDSVEVKAPSIEEVERALASFPPGFDVFVELPTDGDLEAALPLLKAAGARAKVRTGGLTPTLFPSPADLAVFMAACVRHGLPFKATAGLHHPLRGEHPMNGKPDGARATMHGFLNVFIAAALLGDGLSVDEARDLLGETSFDAFGFDDDAVRWRGHRISADGLRVARTRCATSFGSCSFDEPVDDLKAGDLL